MKKDIMLTKEEFYEEVLMPFLLNDVTWVMNNLIKAGEIAKRNILVNEEWPRWVFIPPNVPGQVICVSHMDTVWKDRLNVVLTNRNGVIYNKLVEKASVEDYDKLTGIGADDRLGCATIYLALIEGWLGNHGVLFTEGEEIVIGPYVTALDPELRLRLQDSMPRLFVELDYPGWGVFTTYNPETKDFINAIEKSLLMSRTDGSFSDVKALGEWFGIPEFNMAIGYQRQHRANEFIVLEDWEIQYVKFCKLLGTAYKLIPGKSYIEIG